MTIKIGRKQIVDFIERGNGMNMDEWRPSHLKGGIKGYPIHGFTSTTSRNIKIKYNIPVPNSKLDVVLEYLSEPERRLEYDEGLELFEKSKEYPLNTRLMYGKQKTTWPVGPRDLLLLGHIVKYGNKAWASIFSVEDEDYPVVAGLGRIDVIS